MAFAGALAPTSPAKAGTDRDPMSPEEGPCGILCKAQPAGPTAAAAVVVPSGFEDSIVLSGLTQPTVVRFASDGRIFVAEKSGVIKEFAGLSDGTATIFADLSTNTYNFWDRGLLGLALDPQFPTAPYVYVLYSYDAPIGGAAPFWGTPGVPSDPCPTPPGANTDGCVVSARLSRLTASGDVMVPGSERVLIEDWCQQFPSHSIGSLIFGADGALYVSGGEGASFTNVDLGQYGNTYPGDVVNPCGDPLREGGALRSQDLRTSGDPVGLGGTILRVDPTTGAALPTNPLASSTDPNARRVIAYGLRNPLRFAFRPGTNDLWLGDVGWSNWEEIDRIASPTAGALNFGWPCYEGTGIQASYQATNTPICTGLYAQGNAVAPPVYTYAHSAKVVAGESCPTGSSSISGLSFKSPGGSYPVGYDGALFFADYSRKCIWVMFAGANGLPNPATIQTFVANAAGPVDLEMGPGNDLFYAGFDDGTIRRVVYSSVSGSNLALNRPAAASSIEATGLEASKAVDGAFTTRWSSQFSDPQWISVDLGATYGIGEVILRWEDAYGKAYRIQVSNDASTWTDIFTTSSGDGAVDDLSGLSGSGRYVRMYGTTRGTPWGYSLWEFEVYSTSGPTVTAISPTAGPPGGGTVVTITGTGFSTTSGATTVRFGAASASGVSCSSPTSCVATSPSGSGTVDVTVSVGGLTSATSVADKFTYATNSPPAPNITRPLATLTWKVGDAITFSGEATDPED
jgi:glucose/arabinose dehydrogenase